MTTLSPKSYLLILNWTLRDLRLATGDRGTWTAVDWDLDSSLSIEPRLAAGLVTGSGWGMQSAGAGSVGDKDEVYTYTLDTAANKPGGWSVSKLRFI